jgi:plasmid stability protein
MYYTESAMSSVTTSKGDTVTFRIDPGLKAELTDLAVRHHQSLGGLLRNLAHDRVATEHRRIFEAEARRQSLEAAAAARDPHSDEHTVMHELESDLDAFGNEWK